jgi:hypothetical protein
MSKDLVSDKIMFNGYFCFNLKTGERLVSDTATWFTKQRRLAFPSGCSVDSQPMAVRFLDFNEGTFNLAGGNHEASDDFSHVETGADASLRGLFSQPGGIGPGDLKKFRRSLKEKDFGTLTSLVWQLLILNPGILKQAQISPLALLVPNFKLGAFEPGIQGWGQDLQYNME